MQDIVAIEQLPINPTVHTAVIAGQCTTLPHEWTTVKIKITLIPTNPIPAITPAITSQLSAITIIAKSKTTLGWWWGTAIAITRRVRGLELTALSIEGALD